MANITVQKISRRAKQIRKKGEAWTDAIKRASKQLQSGTVSSSRRSSAPGKKRKTVPHKKKGYKPTKPVHQTGTSSRSRDKLVKAKPPGKRRSKGGKTYYEYRKNRSDMPGKLTGMSKSVNGSAYREMILRHMKDADRARTNAEKQILELKQKKRNVPAKDRLTRRAIDTAIKNLRKFVSSQKKEMSMLKALYR